MGGWARKSLGGSLCTSYTFEIWPESSWDVTHPGPGLRIAAYNAQSPKKVMI
jgi:hypothetical protein